MRTRVGVESRQGYWTTVGSRIDSSAWRVTSTGQLLAKCISHIRRHAEHASVNHREKCATAFRRLILHFGHCHLHVFHSLFRVHLQEHFFGLGGRALHVLEARVHHSHHAVHHRAGLRHSRLHTHRRHAPELPPI